MNTDQPFLWKRKNIEWKTQALAADDGRYCPNPPASDIYTELTRFYTKFTRPGGTV